MRAATEQGGGEPIVRVRGNQSQMTATVDDKLIYKPIEVYLLW